MSHRIGLYLRVSTEEQVLRDEGSLESQKHRLAAFVDLKNVQVPNWGVVVDSYIDEGLSAKDTRRPELQRLMADVRRGRVNLILVTELSRLSRSIRDFCGILDDLNKAKAKFLSLKEQFDTTTAAGEMMIFNMINLAQFERRQISERVSINFHSRALRGLRNGGHTILGYEVDPASKSRLIVCEKEAAEVRLIFNTFIEEGSTYRTAEKLRQLGVTLKVPANHARRLGEIRWTAQTLQTLLRNQSYVGLREVNKMKKGENQEDLKAHERYHLVKAAWPAIIDKETFATVQRILDANQKQERSRRAEGEWRPYLLSGISSCAQCGRSLVGSTGHGRISSTRYYIHRPLEGQPVICNVKCFRADDIEEAVVSHLQAVIEKAGYLEGLEKVFESQMGVTVSLLETKKLKLEQRIAKAEKDIKALIRVQLDADGDTTLRDLYSEELRGLKAQKDADLKLLSQIGSQLLDAPDAKAQRELVQRNLRQIRAAWDKAPAVLRKRLLKTVIQKLVLHYDSIDILYRTDTETGMAGQDGLASLPVTFDALKRQTPLESSDHKSKIQGGYIAGIGSGGRI